MSQDRKTSPSRLAREHIKSFGKEAFSKLKGRLGPENEFKMRFSNGCDMVGIQELCPDPEKGKKILVNVVKSEQPFLAFTLGESGIVELFHFSNPDLSLEGKKFSLNGSLYIGSPNGPIGCSIKDEISAIELGIMLVEKIDKSINKGELEPFDFILNFSSHS
jgi:hypothetical protein